MIQDDKRIAISFSVVKSISKIRRKQRDIKKLREYYNDIKKDKFLNQGKHIILQIDSKEKELNTDILNLIKLISNMSY